MFTYSRTTLTQLLQIIPCSIQLNPNDARTYASRGAIYGIVGEVDKAVIDCTKAIELGLNHPDIYFNRAIGYNSMEKLDLAIKDYTKTIEY